VPHSEIHAENSLIQEGECSMKKIFVISIITLIILACGVPALAPNSAPPTSAPDIAATSAQSQNQMATFVAQTVQAQPPAPTQTPAATAVPPTAAQQATQSSPVAIQPNQNWNGTFLWQDGFKYPVTFAITKVSGSSFTGAMVWSFSICKVTERTQGDIIQDVTSATEQSRWSLHPDFKSGDKGGTWLRWSQVESIGSGRCYLNITGDWYYAHVKNGHMIGIHFANDTNTEPDRNVVFDFTLSQ
jgi:hypothetical protein